jgi:hypothetical protein
MLPEIVIEDLSAPPALLLKETLDMIWNACGCRSSTYFDAAGK